MQRRLLCATGLGGLGALLWGCSAGPESATAGEAMGTTWGPVASSETSVPDSSEATGGTSDADNDTAGGSDSDSATDALTTTGEPTGGDRGGDRAQCPPGTALAGLADRMEPRTWAELDEGLGPLLSAPLYDHPEFGQVGGLNIMTWSDDGQWDPSSAQLLFMGLRQTRRFVAYSAADSTWFDLGLPEDNGAEMMSPPYFSQYGHIYSRNALDPVAGNFYHMADGIYRFDIGATTWSKLPEGGDYDSTGIIEWFSARGELLNYTDTGGLRLFDEQNQTWTELGPTAVHGHHSLGRDNPILGELLLVGGNESPTTVVRVLDDATVEQLPDSPVSLTIRFGMLTVDPLSGRYLILDLEERVFFEFDSETGQYEALDDFSETPWPFENYDHPIVASIPECGVTMWAGKVTMLYKHG